MHANTNNLPIFCSNLRLIEPLDLTEKWARFLTHTDFLAEIFSVKFQRVGTNIPASSYHPRSAVLTGSVLCPILSDTTWRYIRSAHVNYAQFLSKKFSLPAFPVNTPDRKNPTYPALIAQKQKRPLVRVGDNIWRPGTDRRKRDFGDLGKREKWREWRDFGGLGGRNRVWAYGKSVAVRHGPVTNLLHPDLTLLAIYKDANLHKNGSQEGQYAASLNDYAMHHCSSLPHARP
jgi:hypothetical protein